MTDPDFASVLGGKSEAQPAAAAEEKPAPVAEPTPADKPQPTPEADAPAVVPSVEEALSEDDEAALADLDSRLQDVGTAVSDGVKRALREIREEDARAAEEEEADPKDREIATLKSKLAEQEQAVAKEKHAEALKSARAEMQGVVTKYKLTQRELDEVIDYFDNNTDLVGSWSFEKGALRVLPGLADRLKTPPNAGRNGSLEEAGAEVISRGGGGPAPPANPPDFKPGAGKYDDVTLHLRGSGVMSRVLSGGRG